ncbi:unnamed protein product, partial [Urochloa humidicola]
PILSPLPAPSVRLSLSPLRRQAPVLVRLARGAQPQIRGLVSSPPTSRSRRATSTKESCTDGEPLINISTVVDKSFLARGLAGLSCLAEPCFPAFPLICGEGVHRLNDLPVHGAPLPKPLPLE